MKTDYLSVALAAGCFLCASGTHSQTNSPGVETRVNAILNQMTLEEKLDYIGGTPGWSVKPIPRLGIPEIYGTDGTMGFNQSGLFGTPSGPRYPAGIAIAASWNVDLARERGRSLGRDTRARGYYNLLVPGMNFYRIPFNGRNYEYVTGEDPFLGATIAPALVEGLQGEGVWATAKHLVCNDEEENRTNINVVVDERTLREIYLPPFEASVKKGRVANVMGAYNFVNGKQCNENSFLLTEILKNEWGFRGFVESDYLAIHNGLNAALAGCDLDMPFGNFMNSATLLPAIQSGELRVSLIDDKVRKILRRIVSFGFLDRPQFDPSIPADDPASEAVILNDAREGIVLLENAGNLLPLQPGRVRSVAVLGTNAVGAPPTAFGSGFVPPTRIISEFDGIKQAAGSLRVDFISELTLNPQKSVWQSVGATGQVQPGLAGEYFSSNDLSGVPVVTRVDQEINFDWTQTGGIPAAIPPSSQGTFSARWTGQIVPTISGDYVFKARCDGGFRVIVNGQKIIDLFNSPPLPSPSDLIGPTVPSSGKISLVAGQVYTVELDYRRVAGFLGVFGGLQGVQLSWAALEPPPNFASYDAVIICGGISNEYEGEGIDRPFQLPEFQDELIQNVSAINPRTVVVLHGGGSFDVQHWIGQVGGLLQAWYPGQNGGIALGEILFGKINPSAKLPITWEKRIEDNPAFASFPMPLNGNAAEIKYSEGIFVGYRGYEKNGVTPQFPFGFGLSYTSFSYSDLDVEDARKENDRNEHGLRKAGFTEHDREDKDLIKVSFAVSNTGKRAGAEVAELYVGQQNPTVARPIKELKGFKKVFLQPGESRRITLELDQRAFAYFNTTTERWDALADTYNILIGTSSQDIRLKGQFTLQSELTSQP